MIPEISHSAEPYNSGILYEKLWLGPFPHGTHLTYYWSSKKGFWELEYLQTDPPINRRKGYGSALLQEFVKRVGQGQPIHGAIIDDATIEILTRIFPSGPYPAQLDQNLFSALPMVQLFTKGGIIVDSIHLSPLDDDSYESAPFGIDIYGHTGLT